MIVWIHGGGCQKGGKAECPITWLCDAGFAVASVDYRLTDLAQWPAQIDDCRAAIAFLRNEQLKLGINADRIGVASSSAGGHLVALIGTLDHDDGRSGVQAVCDFFGPTDLLTMPKNVDSGGKTQAELAAAPGAKLLGGIVRDHLDLAKQASVQSRC